MRNKPIRTMFEVKSLYKNLQNDIRIILYLADRSVRRVPVFDQYRIFDNRRSGFGYGLARMIYCQFSFLINQMQYLYIQHNLAYPKRSDY